MDQKHECQVKAMIFDLDGTLIESFNIVKNTLIIALQRCGFQPPEEDVYAEIFGRSEEDVLKKIHIPLKSIPQICKEWTRASEEYAGEISYYDGIPQLIRTLKNMGYALGVVTGRSREKTRVVPVARELEVMMDAFVTPEDTRNGKPDPEPVFYAMSKLGSTPDKTIFIGDSVNDITAASLAGCQSILVTWGGVKDASGFPYPPDFIVSSVNELESLLLGYPSPIPNASLP